MSSQRLDQRLDVVIVMREETAHSLRSVMRMLAPSANAIGDFRDAVDRVDDAWIFPIPTGSFVRRSNGR